MATSIEDHEKTIKEMVAILFPGRPVLYANERVAEPTAPYVLIAPLPSVGAGLPYKAYTNQEDPGLDLNEQIARPIELTVSVTFIGGNARGELALLLAGLIDEDVINTLKSACMSYLRDSGARDISENIGGDFEQRAQADIVFACFILPDTRVIPAVATLNIHGDHKNSSGGDVIHTDIII